MLLEYSRIVKLPTEHNLEFLSIKGGCTGSSESTPVKIPHCWKSCVTAHMKVALTTDVYVIKINCNPTIYWCYDAIHRGSIVAEQEQSGIHNNNIDVTLTIDVYVLKINCTGVMMPFIMEALSLSRNKVAFTTVI